MSISTKWRRSAVTLSMMALMGLTISATGAAHADEFSTANTAPTVTTPALSTPMQPDTGASDAVYSYAVVVGDAESLNDLSTVTVCLYLTTGGDSTCATPDPTTDVSMTWTQTTNAFTMASGTSAYWALGAEGNVSVSPTLTNTSGTFTFNFMVSEAMREGEWTAAVTATDVSAATGSDATATTTVNHYSAITTRVAQDFGTVAAGAAGAISTATPTVISNGRTTYSATASNFTDGTYAFTLKTDGATSVAPAAGEVTFDCEVASTFTEANAVRVGSSTLLSGDQTPTGAPEDGSDITNTCRLAHGGERPVSTYAATVVNAIGNG